MRIAHLSDLHLLDLKGAIPFRLLNKRLTGYLNLRFHRRSVHKLSAAEATARAIRELDVDHVVVTGDVSNLALEAELLLVRAFLENSLGLPPEQVSLVPGNHDVYTSGSFRAQRFFQTLGHFATSDLPNIASKGNAGQFPFVRLRGPVAIIGLSTAVPRLPFVAAGRLGEPQRDALEHLLTHPEVRSRTPVFLQHHPWHNPENLAKRLLEGLDDAPEQARLLRDLPRGLLLHGHLHRRVHRMLTTDRGHVDAVGATSASLLHDSDEKMAGFNLYDITDDGRIASITSHRFDPSGERFFEVPLPRS